MSIALAQYPKVPHMRCDVGCGGCCGPVVCQTEEYERIDQYAADMGIKPIRQGSTCPWFQGGTCAVYPVRPWICHMFGHSPRLVCERGYNVMIPEKREVRYTEEYLSEGVPDRFLHSVIYSESEITSLLVEEFSPKAVQP